MILSSSDAQAERLSNSFATEKLCAASDRSQSSELTVIHAWLLSIRAKVEAGDYRLKTGDGTALIEIQSEAANVLTALLKRKH